MTPREMTQKRRPVTASSRNRISPVTHHGSSPRDDSTTSADPVSALSAIGSAILPKSVIRLRRRASSPSRKSVAEARPNVTQAATRRTSPPDTRRNTNKGTRPRRRTVSAFAILIRPGGGPAPAVPSPGPSAAPASGRLNAPPASRRRGARRGGHGGARARGTPCPGQQTRGPRTRQRGPGHVTHREAAAHSHLPPPLDLPGLMRGAAGGSPPALPI